MKCFTWSVRKRAEIEDLDDEIWSLIEEGEEYEKLVERLNNKIEEMT